MYFGRLFKVILQSGDTAFDLSCRSDKDRYIYITSSGSLKKAGQIDSWYKSGDGEIKNISK